MSSCAVLLEPTVTFIHLQQCDELLDKFLVGFSIYTGFQKTKVVLLDASKWHTTRLFFVDAKEFQCNYVGFQFSMFSSFGHLHNH